MSKEISERVNTQTEQTTNEPASGELSEKELQQVSGGTINSSVMKTKHDTVKNTVSNIH